MGLASSVDVPRIAYWNQANSSEASGSIRHIHLIILWQGICGRKSTVEQEQGPVLVGQGHMVSISSRRNEFEKLERKVPEFRVYTLDNRENN